MPEIPREPGFYYPSTHATVRKNEREIPWTKASQTIAEGTVKQSHKDGCKLFVKEFDNEPYPIGVVANYECGEILTVEYRK